MPCKPGVAGLIPGFSIKTTFGEPLGVPVIKTNTNLKPTRRNWFIPRKATKKQMRGQVTKAMIVWKIVNIYLVII